MTNKDVLETGRKIDLSIIIVSYNCASILNRCLQSISKSILNLRYEIICVDNHSTDNTVDQISENFPGVHLIVNEHNMGFACANNIAEKASNADFLLFLNPDTLIIDNAIETAFNFMATNSRIGLVGIQLLNEDGSPQVSSKSFPTIWYYFMESTFLYYFHSKVKRFMRRSRSECASLDPFATDVISGAFLLVRRKTFKQLSGFDESFFMYSEEDDFSYRLHEKGWKAVLVPAAKVIHYGGYSTKPIWSKMFVEMHKSKLIFFAKHHGILKALIAATLLFFGVVLRLFFWAAAASILFLISSEMRSNALSKLRNYTAAFAWYLRLEFLKEFNKQLKSD